MNPAKRTYEPVLYEYLKKYQENPSSRVFAPLAEAYRKAGLIDEAIDIAREGLRVHPRFVSGIVALARALFDKKKYAEVTQELSWVVRDVPDNLVAQKLMGESCLMLGRTAEALSSYKMLLYFAPQDPEAAQMVEELESSAYENGVMVLRTDLSKSDFSEHSAGEAIDQDPKQAKARWIGHIQTLLECLQRVERYRSKTIH
ncbi:MAG: hypothetical protein AABZ55_10305 [Bdellovibrionota bacterium]